MTLPGYLLQYLWERLILFQVVAIVMGIVIFRTPVTALSFLGISLTTFGIAWYTMSSYRAKQKALAVIGEMKPVPVGADDKV